MILAAAPRRPYPFGAPLHVGIWFAWRLRRIKCALLGQAVGPAGRLKSGCAALPIPFKAPLSITVWDMTYLAAAPHQFCPFEESSTVGPMGQDKRGCAALLMPYTTPLLVQNILTSLRPLRYLYMLKYHLQGGCAATAVPLEACSTVYLKGRWM